MPNAGWSGAASGAAAGTAIMPGVGTIIGAGIGLLGGMFSSKSAAKAEARSREDAQNRIQWAVADARKAGVHPLAALGMSQQSVAYSTGSATGDAIQQIGKTYSRQQINKGLNAAQIKSYEAAAERDFALASATTAATARAKQASNSQPTGRPVTSMMLPDQTIGHPGNTRKLGSAFDVQSAEDRYWEFGGAAAGIANVGGDLVEYLVPQAVVDRAVSRYIKNLPAKKRSRAITHKYDPYTVSP